MADGGWTPTGKRVYAIPKDWLLNLMRASQGHHVRRDAEIPADARVVGVEYIAVQDMLLLTVQAEQFFDKYATDTHLLKQVVW